MTKKIDTKLCSIQNLFINSVDNILGEDGKFYIPEYQRAYNWDKNRQCDKLWQDLETFITNKSNERYFFGSIIINNSNDKISLIDGQQRITTFFLLLKALLLKIDSVLKKHIEDDETKELNEALKKRREELIQCLFLIDKDDIYRLTQGIDKYSDYEIKYCNESINETYKYEVQTILKGESVEEIKNSVEKIKWKQKDNRYTNFFKNFKFFVDKINEMQLDNISTFAKDLLENCQVIVITSYEMEEAIQIFNSLNSTGLPLADADIISAKLYANLLEKDKIEVFKENWEDILDSTDLLSSKKIVSIDDILNQYMYILRAKFNEKETTLPSIRRYFSELHKETLKTPAVFISDIKDIINIWMYDDCIGENINEHSNAELIELSNIKQILLKCNSNFKLYYSTYMFINKDKDISEKIQFSKALLKLFIILTITGKTYSSADFKQFLINLNMCIGKSFDTKELVFMLNNHIKNKFNNIDEIEKNLKENYAYTNLIYLNEYLFAKGKGKMLDLNKEGIQIEHIMPQCGRRAKFETIRQDANIKTQEEFGEYVDMLGNKILLEHDINGSISNSWFVYKKQNSIKDKMGYKDSSFSIAESLINYDKNLWQKEDIQKATQKAINRIVKFLYEE